MDENKCVFFARKEKTLDALNAYQEIEKFPTDYLAASAA